jgi:hypothetical protein
MSITTAKYLDNSTIQITSSYTAGGALSTMTSFALFAAAIADAITGTQPGSAGTYTTAAGTAITFTGTTTQASSGWTLFDAFWGGPTGVASAASPVYTQVFRSANVVDSVGAVSYKNIIIRYNTREGTINTSTCEWWGDTFDNYKASSPSAITNHAPFNEAWTHFDCSPVGYNLTACDIIIMVSPRWCFIHSYLNNEASMWSGVVEMAREDVTDTVANGYPCWGWIGSALWALGTTSLTNGLVKPLNNLDYTLISLPRTRLGATGANASRNWSADYGTASYPNWLSSTTGPFAYYLGNQVNKFVTNAWDGSRRLALPIKPIADFAGPAIANYGQIYGMKVVSPVGTNMNKITIPTDSSGNAASNGTDRNHWLLNIHHKTFSTDNTSWFPGVTAGNTTMTVENIANTGGVLKPISMVSTGISYYCISFGGVSITKINALSKLAAASAIVTLSGGFTDIKYDGERFVYATCSVAANALIRIDTIDDTFQTFNNATGLGSIAINGTTVIAASTTAAAQPTLYRFDRLAQNASSSTAIAASTTATQTSATLTAATSLIKDLTCDFDGNFIGAAYTATAANTPVCKYPAAGTIGTVLQLGTSGVISLTQGIQILNGENFILWYANASSIYQAQFNPRTFTSISIGSAVALVNTTSITGGVITSAKIQGALITCSAGTTVVNNFAVNSLGKVAAATPTVLGLPVLQLDQGTSLVLSGAGQLGYNFIYCDGARVFMNNDTSIKVFTNVNGGNTIGGNPVPTISLGQVAIPA